MISVRKTIDADGGAIRRLASAEPLFSSDDREVVAELLAEYLDEPVGGDYLFLSAVTDGAVVGFACFGPTPLTRGTYDLYWICVARSHRRRGVGRALLRGVVRGVRREGGRLIVLDTSGKAAFAPTRAFYARAGFKASACVPGFYGPGDDLVMYYLPVRRRSRPGGAGRRGRR